jgi:hypothetical protein
MNRKCYLRKPFTALAFERLLLFQRQAKRLIYVGVLSIATVHAGAASLPSWFSPTLLWAGSYHGDEDLVNRADVKFRLNFTKVSPWLDFSVRTQLLDARPSDDVFSDGVTVLGTGVYHNPTGSRILYGPLDIGGLSARIRNIYRHGAPFVTAHSGHTADLKTDPGASPTNAFAARLVAPPLWGWQMSTAFTAEDEYTRNGFFLGAERTLNSRIKAAAEFYFQGATLPVRKASAWFSEKPPLPERDTRIYAGTVRILSPLVSAAADLAYSETFAFGRGMYGNLGLQFGNRPWRISLAVDTVTPRFVDSTGAIPGQGLRIGGKIERFMPRGELWRIATTLRGYGPDDNETFTHSSSSLYYHFPAVKSMFSLSQVSLSASRNATVRTKILDSWHFNIGINAGRVRTKTSCTLDEYTHDDTPSPFPDRECRYVIYGWRIDEEVVVSLNFLTLTATLGYHKKLDAATARWNDAEIPFSLSAQFHNAPGRVTVKFACSDFPQGWQLGVSWRFSLRLSP